jgi:uncharacterized domain HDIG
MKKNLEKEFYEIINPIINNKEFLKRKKFSHHGEESVYEHSLKVAFKAYKMAKKLKLDYKSAAIGGILHDFYTTPWMNAEKTRRFWKMHGFTHAKIAYDNVCTYFPEYATPKIKDIIKKHMWPLNIRLPRYRETWIVTLSDKLVSLSVFKKPKDLPLYLGFKKRKK